MLVTEADVTESILKAYSVGEEVYVEGYFDDSALYITVLEQDELENELIDQRVLTLEKFSDDLTVQKPGVKMKESTYIDLAFIETPIEKDLYSFEKEGDGQVIIGFSETLWISDVEYSVYIEKIMDSMNYSVSVLLPFYVLLYTVSVGIAFFVTLRLSAHITKPITEIMRSTAAIAELDFSKKIEYDGEDELGELVNHINDLSVQLSHTMSTLMRELHDGQEKEKERSDFFASVSHELKTPLSVSRGYIEFLVDGVRKDKADEYLRILQDENERMSEIVMNMLHLIHFENKADISTSQQAILPLIHEARRHFDVMLSEKNMKMRISGTFVKCCFDEKSLIRVLINLMSNGINYGVEGQTIEIVGEVQEEKQKISIRNKAANYGDIDMDSIFHKFYTTDTSRNRKTSGSGLGLAIVKTILEKCDSAYSARLEEDCFVFDFYLDTAHHASMA